MYPIRFSEMEHLFSAFYGQRSVAYLILTNTYSLDLSNPSQINIFHIGGLLNSHEHPTCYEQLAKFKVQCNKIFLSWQWWFGGVLHAIILNNSWNIDGCFKLVQAVCMHSFWLRSQP